MSENVSRVQRGSKVPVVNLPNALTVLRDPRGRITYRYK